jgi:2-polyprenyl-3-methyl-5-hydroxy-6-metoxy-1,4-benzoquinol methylase
VSKDQQNCGSDTLETREVLERVNAHFEEQAEYWEKLYSSDSVFGEIHKYRLSAVLSIVKQLELLPGTALLEVGCGAGFLAAALAGQGYLVNAIDSTEGMIHLTSRRAQLAGVDQRVKASLGDVHRLCFPHGQFSLVLAIGVLPWLPSPREAILEMARVVRPGGHLIFTMDNSWRLNHTLDPRESPLFEPFRWATRKLFEIPPFEPVKRLVRRAVRGSKPARSTDTQIVAHFHSSREVNRIVSEAGLIKERLTTLGFGPFSFWGRPVVPNRTGVKLQRALQGLADEQWPGIESAGNQFLILARRPSRGDAATNNPSPA